MPHQFEKLGKTIPRPFDRRIRLTDEQRAEIRETPRSVSHNALAAKFGVSKRTIQFIRDPEKLRENKLRREERGGTMQYYDKDKHRETMQEHRTYKKKLFDDGLL